MDPRRPTTIDPGPGNTVTEVEQPEHGTVDVRDGDIIYTPEPGYLGPVEIPVTVTDRRGNVSQTVLTLNVGREQTVPFAFPSSLKIGDNVLAERPIVSNAKQRAIIGVSCWPLMRLGKAGDVRLCDTWVSEGRTYLRIHAPAKVEVNVLAPAKGAFAPYDVTKKYLVR